MEELYGDGRTIMRPSIGPLNGLSQSGTKVPSMEVPLSPSFSACANCPAVNAGSPMLSVSPSYELR